MTSRRLVAAIALVIAVLGPAGSLEAAKPYSAERFTVKLSVETGGSMVVTETVRFAFGPDQFTYVFRELTARRVDRLTVLSVEMDGVPFSPGKRAGQYDIRKPDGGRRRITWHFVPTTRSSHEFTLVYRAEGVIEQGGQSDVLSWLILPGKHEYPIDCAEIEVEYPESAGLVARPEFVPAAEPGANARPLRARRCGFGRDDGWMITLRFAPNSVATAAPAWQRGSVQTRKTAPLFLGLAGLVLFGGLAGFIMFALNHRNPTPADSRPLQTVAPDELPVALAATLCGVGGVSWSGSIGTLLDLARRGVLEIKMPEHSSWLNRRDYAIVLRDRTLPLRDHERTLVDILFTTGKGPRDTVQFSQLSRAFTSGGGWKRFARAVKADLRQEGMLDIERERARSGATRVGLGLIIAALAGFGATLPFIDRVGAFVLTIPGALMIAGVTGIIVGQTLTPLSDIGLRRARLWTAYRRHLAAASKGQRPDLRPDQLESLLPIAAAFGVALAWAKRLDKQGALGVPAWFQAPARKDGRPNSAAVIEMLSLANAAGIHVAGGAVAAGAGHAAGGGSSGAG